MKILGIAPSLSLLLIVTSLSPLHAQTPANPPADTVAKSANPAPSGQAPEEMTKKIAGLVHAGKYAEAQKLTTCLLVAYPDDQRLIKAKALLDQSLASSKSADPAANGNPPTNDATSTQPATNTSANQITGMDKVEFSALIVLAREAKQTDDLSEQKNLLHQFMDE